MDNDLLVEQHITKLRAVARSGQQHLLYLQGVTRRYVRQSRAAERKMDELLDGRISELLDVDVDEKWERNLAIRFGIARDNEENRSYDKIEKWFGQVNDAAEEYFPEPHYEEYLDLPQPPVPSVIPDDTNVRGLDSSERHITELTEAITARLDLLTASLVELGQHEDITPAVRDDQGGWPHLRGLLDDAMIDGYLRSMRAHRRRVDRAAAIGAAKEIVEATLKALAKRHDVKLPNAIEFAPLWRAVEHLFSDDKIDKALGSKKGAVKKLISSQRALIQNLGELRNDVGDGHGKAELPTGLKPEHALLAVDTAHTLTRYIATAVKPS